MPQSSFFLSHLKVELVSSRAARCMLGALLICPKVQHILRNTTSRFMVDLLSLFFVCNWHFIFFAQYFPILVFSHLLLMDTILNFYMLNYFRFSEALSCLSFCSYCIPLNNSLVSFMVLQMTECLSFCPCPSF